MDKLKGQIKEQLNDREYERLERPLEIIERDRQINAEFKRLRRQGYKVQEAIIKLAKQSWNGQYLSEDWIEEIVYPRNR